jgi:hypothetical protein
VKPNNPALRFFNNLYEELVSFSVDGPPTPDKDCRGSIRFNEFFLIMSLYSARECAQTCQFLYNHGKLVFTFLADKQDSTRLTYEQFIRLGYVGGWGMEDRGWG